MSVVELTKDNFEEVITSNATVIVDYWAPWCGPCKGFAPVFEKVADKNPDVVSLLRKFNVTRTDDSVSISATIPAETVKQFVSKQK